MAKGKGKKTGKSSQSKESTKKHKGGTKGGGNSSEGERGEKRRKVEKSKGGGSGPGRKESPGNDEMVISQDDHLKYAAPVLHSQSTGLKRTCQHAPKK